MSADTITRLNAALEGRYRLERRLLTRRAFLASTAGTVVIIALPGCAPRSGLSEPERRAVLRMARSLYPHESLDDEVYLQSLEPFLALADDDPARVTQVTSGLESLDQAVGGDWSEAPPGDQIRALATVEDSAFFRTIQEVVRAQLYEHPAVWELLGYEGSSVEYGGYINRGFDDIDWLPEE